MKREISISKVKNKYRVVSRYDAYLQSIYRNIQNMTFSMKDKCYYTDALGIIKILDTFKNSTSYQVSFADADFQINDFFEDVKTLQREAKEKEDAKNSHLVALEVFEKDKNLHLDFLGILNDGVKLYHYQAVAVKYMSLLKSGLIALVPGLGKTLVSITYAEYNKLEKVLVICSNSLKYNFKNEVEKFTKSKAYILKATKSINTHPPEECKYFIVNYEYFAKNKNKFNYDKDEVLLSLPKFDLTILDESHRIKNPKSNTYKNIKAFISPIERKLFLSGTPAPNRIDELYTVLNLISPQNFPNKSKYYEEYCGMVYDKYNFGWVKKHDVDLDKLFNTLKAFSYRKRKEDVLDLPKKNIIPVITKLKNKEKKEYFEIAQGAIREIDSKPTVRETPLTQMQKLRQFTANYKINMIRDLINQILDTGEKVVVIDIYKETLFKLREIYPKISVVHTGDETPEARALVVKEFQEDPGKRIFFGTISTAKEGITLTAANNMIIISQPFSVGEDEQVQDRIHRIGQKYNVNIYYPIVEKTIDDSVYYLIENKKKNILKAIDNIDYKKGMKRTIFNDLLNQMRKKYLDF